MKKKFVVLALCFTLIFSSLSFKKSYAFDGGIISAPIVGVVASVAVASGVVLNNSDDIVNLANNFYHTYKDKQEEIRQLFNASVSIAANGVVSVGSDFLNYVKEFLDFTNASKYGSVIGYYEGIPVYDYVGYNYARNVNSLKFSLPLDGAPFKYGNFEFKYFNNYTWAYHNGELICQIYETKQTNFNICIVKEQSGSFRFYNVNDDGSIGSLTQYFLHFTPSYDSVFTGSFENYNWDNVSDKIVDDSIDIYVPGNVDSLVGVPSGSVVVGDVFNPPYELPNNGVVGIPNVGNPSIDIDDSVSFPVVGDNSNVACSECGLVGTHSSTCSKANTGNPPIGLPEFPSWGEGLDFSPITESDISDKFPFCLAKDLSNLIGVFDVGEKEPVFDVPFLGEVYTIDLAQFTVWADIIKFFTLITFIFGLIKITRGIIG